MAERVSKFLVIVLAAGTLAACGAVMKKEEEAEPAAVEERVTPSEEEAGPSAATGGVAESEFEGHPLDDPSSLLSDQTIYFDFDKSDIKPEFRSLVEAHAEYLSNHPSAAVTLEGHADERGTREYNIALGERRASAVMRLMTLLGASGQQVRKVSYGEERPAVLGHDESAWSKNRRVKIVYRNRG